MACDAIARAKRLINDEGLHLAEHILLRPQTADECQCAKRQRRGEDKDAGTGCEFRWTNPGDPDLCIDPWKYVLFLVKILFPLLQRLFCRHGRNVTVRKITGKLLKRFAAGSAAHVLLRILWLTPHDLCRFETMFRKWQLYLAYKTMCGDQFDYCAFIEFFFHYRWERLAECTSCKPCEEPAAQLPCEEVMAVERYSRRKFLSDTDQLFSWKDPQFLLMKKMIAGKLTMAPALETVSLPKKMELPVEPLVQPGKEIDAIIKKPKRVFVNQRRTARKEMISELQAELKKMDVAGEVASFLDDANPDAARLEKITSKLLTKVKTVKGKKPSLNKKHALELLGLAVHHYLDKQVFNGKDPDKINAMAGSLAKAGEAGLDIVNIYKDWQPAEVQKYEADLPAEAIKKIFLGKS